MRLFYRWICSLINITSRSPYPKMPHPLCTWYMRMRISSARLVLSKSEVWKDGAPPSSTQQVAPPHEANLVIGCVKTVEMMK